MRETQKVDWELSDCDEELLRTLQAQASVLGGRWYHDMTVAEARDAFRRLCQSRAQLPGVSLPDVDVSEEVFQLATMPMPMRIYRARNSELTPVVVFFHGGGWVFGDIDSYDETARIICDQCKVIVVSVGYPLAPESRFPIPLLACIRAIRWTKENIGGYGGDPDAVLVMGDSAGGNLSAAAALECSRLGIELIGQVVVYAPLVHVDHAQAIGLPSWAERRQRFGPTSASATWYWQHYVESSDIGLDPRASVLLDRHVRGAPPALIAAGALDSFAPECAAYADLLASSGVKAKYIEYPRITHGFISHGWLPPGQRSRLAHASTLDLFAHVRRLAYTGQLDEPGLDG